MPNYQPVEYRDYMDCDLYFHKDQDDGSLLSYIYLQGAFLFDCEDEIRWQIRADQLSLFGPFELDD